MIVYAHPAPIGGAYASSRTSGGMRWTRAASSDEGCGRRAAKACGPDLPMLGSSSGSRARGDGGYRAGHRGERAISRKTLRREGRNVSAYLYSLVCFLCFLPRTRGCGCDRSIRLSLRPLSFRRVPRLTQTSRRSCRGNAWSYYSLSCHASFSSYAEASTAAACDPGFAA